MKLGPASTTVTLVTLLVLGMFSAFTGVVHPEFYSEPLGTLAGTVAGWLVGGVLCGLAVVFGMALHYTRHGERALDQELLEQGTTRRVVVPGEPAAVLAQARAAAARGGRIRWVVDDPEGGTLVGSLRDRVLALPGVDETWLSISVRPAAGGTELSLRRRARTTALALHPHEDAFIERVLDEVLDAGAHPERAAAASTPGLRRVTAAAGYSVG